MKNNEKQTTKPNNGLSSEDVETVMLCGLAENVEQQLISELEAIKTHSQTTVLAEKEAITDFTKLPLEAVFSQNAVYKLYNRDNGMEFYIDGKDLEARIGLDDTLYDKVQSRSVKVFGIDNSIISFYKWESPKRA